MATPIGDIRIVSKSKLNITSNGQNVKMFKYASTDGVSQAEIKQKLEHWKSINPTFNNNKYSIAVDLDFREAGWRSSEFQKVNTNIDNYVLFDIFDYYDQKDEVRNAFLDKIGLDDFEDYKYYNFNFYLKYDGEEEGGNDELNNCLYKCLLKACSVKTNYTFNKPSVLKEALGLKVDAKIPIDKIPRIEELMCVSIRVEGDYTYEPLRMRPVHINLILKNGHYTRKDDITHKVIRNAIYNKKRHCLFVCNGKKYYNGETEGIFNGDFKKINDRSKKAYIHMTKSECLEEEYAKVMKDIEKLKEATNIDILEYGNIPAVSLKSFYDLCITKRGNGCSPEPIGQLEASWLDKATTGGIMYSVHNQTCEKAYCYDVNSLYPHTMLSLKFPASQGVFMKLNELPETISYLFIVRASIEKGHKLFRYNKHNLYTSYDLQNAKRLKLSVELIDDDINCLSYEKSRIIEGEHFFKPFIHYWYEMKKKNVPFSKLILNSLWGVLSQKDKMKYPVKRDESFYAPDGYTLTKMTQQAKHDFSYEFKNQLSPFKYSYARLKPFLLSKSKSHILTSSINYHINNETILFSHTDSLITNKPLNFKLSDEMGKWKLEHEGKIHIKNLKEKKWT